MKTLVEKSMITISMTFVMLVTSPQTFADDYSKKISYADLNLSQPKDVTVLYERIQAAADKVCKASSAPRDGHHRRNYNRCYQGAVELAVKEVDNVALTALHQGNSGRIASR